MSRMLRAPLSEHGSTLPIPSLDFSAGLHTQVDNALSWPLQIPTSGAYLITSTVGVYVSHGQESGASEGSIFIAAGVPFHALLEAGTLYAAAVKDEIGQLFVVPLR